MEGMIGEVRLFSGTFAPLYWAFCDGRLLAVAQYTPLFAIIGAYYGGDGRTTFGLPDLRSRVPVGAGQSPGHNPYYMGQKGGLESVILTQNELPAHTHLAQATAASSLTGNITVKMPVNTEEAEGSNPTGMVLATNTNMAIYAEEPTAQQHLAPAAVNNTLDVQTNIQISLNQTGGGAYINNVQPYIGLNYIICLEGYFPPRS